MTKAEVFKKRNYQSETTDKAIAEGGTKFIAKVFLYMFGALAITAATTLILAALLIYVFKVGSSSGVNVLTGIIGGMVILYIPLIIWIQISVLRGGKGLTPAFVIYSVMLGALFSPIVALIQAIDGAAILEFPLMGVVGIAFALTCAVFAVMALIAWTTKKDLSFIGVLGYGLLSGLFMIALLGIIVGLFSGTAAAILSAGVSAGFFIFVILVTLFDLYNIRRIAARGEASSNLAMVCAFSLYTDFVYIFVKILEFVLRLAVVFGRNR